MKTKVIFFIAMMQAMLIAEAQEKRTFLHPGGLHTEADFQRMREHRYETPWRQSWQEIQGDGYAQSTRGNEATTIISVVEAIDKLRRAMLMPSI